MLRAQYGAEMMESSVKTISRPVIDRLPVNQLDEFACRQLDRVSPISEVSAWHYSSQEQFGGYGRRRSSPDPRELDRQREQSPASRDRGWTSALRDMSMARGRPSSRGEEPTNLYRDRDEDINMARDEGKGCA